MIHIIANMTLVPAKLNVFLNIQLMRIISTVKGRNLNVQANF